MAACTICNTLVLSLLIFWLMLFWRVPILCQIFSNLLSFHQLASVFLGRQRLWTFGPYLLCPRHWLDLLVSRLDSRVANCWLIGAWAYK